MSGHANHTPASLSWRAGGEGSQQLREQQEKAQREQQRDAHNNHGTSTLASMVVPSLSIGMPSGSAPDSTDDSDTDKKATSPSQTTENPQLQSEKIKHHHRNPFAIGALRQDGKTETRTRMRKRDRIAKAGRSLSPFRHHGRSHSLSRLPSVLAAGWAHYGERKLLSPPKRSKEMEDSTSASEGEKDADTESETDTDSIAKGLCPRNTAFGEKRDGEEGRGEGDSDDSDDDWDKVGQADTNTSDDASERKELGDEEPTSKADEEEDDTGLDFDDATIDNTLFNAGCLDLHGAWQNNSESIGEGGWYPEDDDPAHDHTGMGPADPNNHGYSSSDGTRTAPLDGTAPVSPSNDPHSRLPNVILPSSFKPEEPKPEGSKWVSSSGSGSNAFRLVASRPVFARNRCTITLVHGEYEEAVEKRESGGGGRGPKKWIVASDGSEESSYAIEWTIGTVLRDGDETLVVSVMETSEKLDPVHKTENATAKAALKENEGIRQSMAVILARQATALLQRTRLAVKISCQALHAKHARHMLLDLIDFYQPTMVIVGSRGLGSLKGILLGSTSHYLVQKSSVPVMVARKRLQLPALPRGKGDVVSSVRRRHMRLDEAAIEKKSKVAEEKDDDGDGDGDGEGEGDATDAEADRSSTDTDNEGEEHADKARESTDAEVETPEGTGKSSKTDTQDATAAQDSAAPTTGEEGTPRPSRGDSNHEERGRSRSRTDR